MEQGKCFREMTTYRSPDLMLQEKQTKTIWICEMVSLQERNIEKKSLHATYFRERREREREELHLELKLCR